MSNTPKSDFSFGRISYAGLIAVTGLAYVGGGIAGGGDVFAGYSLPIINSWVVRTCMIIFGIICIGMGVISLVYEALPAKLFSILALAAVVILVAITLFPTLPSVEFWSKRQPFPISNAQITDVRIDQQYRFFGLKDKITIAGNKLDFGFYFIGFGAVTCDISIGAAENLRTILYAEKPKRETTVFPHIIIEAADSTVFEYDLPFEKEHPSRGV
jgi:hypothetical protein